MRVVLGLLMLAAVWCGADVSGEPEVDDGLLAIRAALGGSAALDSVRTFRMEGKDTRVIGPLRLASEVTITVVRPDHYLRVDTTTLAGRSTETAVGFAGSVVVQSARGQDGVRIDPATLIPAAARDQVLRAAAQEQRRDLRRLLLGCLAGPFDATSMAIRARGLAEAADGRADLTRLTFADASEATLFSDTATHLPVMVTWEGPDVLATLQGIGRRTEERARSSPVAAPPASSSSIEHRFYFSDFRAVGALRWPFVIRRAAAGELVEELRIDRVVINPPIDLALFDASR
jgi:hypothetical protein